MMIAMVGIVWISQCCSTSTFILNILGGIICKEDVTYIVNPWDLSTKPIRLLKIWAYSNVSQQLIYLGIMMNSSPWKIVNCDATVDNSGRVSSISPDGPIKRGNAIEIRCIHKDFRGNLFDVWCLIISENIAAKDGPDGNNMCIYIYICIYMYIYIHISVQRSLKAGFTKICFNIMAKNHFQHQVKRISLYGGSD